MPKLGYIIWRGYFDLEVLLLWCGGGGVFELEGYRIIYVLADNLCFGNYNLGGN